MSSSDFIQMLQEQIVAFRPNQPIRSEDFNKNFSVILGHIERLENILVKIYKKQELKGSDLFFQSSVDLLYGKSEKSGRYGILKNKEK